MTPAEWVYGKPMRDTLPITDGQLSRGWKSTMRDREYQSKVHMRQNFEIKNRKAKEPLSAGQKVVIQNHVSKKWSTYGEIIGPGINEFEYMIKTDGGSMLRRNHRFVKPIETTPKVFDSKPHAREDTQRTTLTKRNTELNKSATIATPEERERDGVVETNTERPKRNVKRPVRFSD